MEVDVENICSKYELHKKVNDISRRVQCFEDSFFSFNGVLSKEIEEYKSIKSKIVKTNKLYIQNHEEHYSIIEEYINKNNKVSKKEIRNLVYRLKRNVVRIKGIEERLDSLDIKMKSFLHKIRKRNIL